VRSSNSPSSSSRTVVNRGSASDMVPDTIRPSSTRQIANPSAAVIYTCMVPPQSSNA
jgi:hypothetical protein